MSVSGHLVFDAASLAESANVGAHIRAGDDGTVIGHVSDALKVSIANASVAVTATDLDIRNLAFATDTVDVSGSSVTVSATNLDIRDLAAATDSVSAWTKDGAGNAITSTTGFLDVNIASSTGTFTVTDAALANTAGSNAATSVGTSSISLAASILSARKYLFAYNNANKAMYLGFGTVTSANGFPMYPGQAYEFRAGPALDMKVISTAAAQDARIMQLS